SAADVRLRRVFGTHRWRWKESRSPHAIGSSISESSPQEAFDERIPALPLNTMECGENLEAGFRPWTIGVVAGLAVPEYARLRFHSGQSGSKSNAVRRRCGGIRDGYGQRLAKGEDSRPVPQIVRSTRCNTDQPFPIHNA